MILSVFNENHIITHHHRTTTPILFRGNYACYGVPVAERCPGCYIYTYTQERRTAGYVKKYG